jgi:hypothetical protein
VTASPENCFLTDLLETGKISAPAASTQLTDALALLPQAIARADAAARLELPGNPPLLSMPAAVWAATIFYQACQFLVHRQFDAAAVRAALGKRCPEGANPSSSYSVDLVFRYLPDLLSLARGIAHDDPLVERLMILARQWPLSSVGIALPAGVDPTPFLKDRCLLTLYAERIIARQDVARLNHPMVCQAVRGAIGLHSQLSPAIAVALTKENR